MTTHGSAQPYGLTAPIATFLSLVFGLFFSTSIRAQWSELSEKVTIHQTNTNALAVIKALQAQTHFTFTYTETALEEVKIRELQFNDVPLGKVLENLQQQHHLVFAIRQLNISVKPAAIPSDVKPLSAIEVSGRITDEKGNGPLVGVTIIVKGLRQTVITDANGAFSLKVPDENSILVISYTGFEGREIRVGKNAMLFISLKPLGKSLEEVTVAARRKVNTEAALLTDRKNAAIVSDGISAKQIEKTASITTTQALQKVAGVTVTDDRYVAIRGLGDRSVIAELNGARLSSSNPDRSSIPLDLIPATLLDNVTVYKTVTPDRPADASGGIVELKTKSVPDSAVFTVMVQTGFNSSIGIGGKFNAWDHYGMGFFGQNVNKSDLSKDFLNLNTQYPNGLPQIRQLFADSRNSTALLQEANRVNGIMHEFSPTITTSYQKAPVNQVYSVTYGNTYKIFGGHSLGVILGGSYYTRTEDISGAKLNQYSLFQGVATGDPYIYSYRHIPNYITPNTLNLGRYLTYTENTGTQTLNYGLLGGLTYRINARNEISLQYLLSKGADVTGTHLDGYFDYSGLPGTVYNTIYSLKQTFRTLNTFNLQGEHKLWPGNYTPRISYNLSTSTSSENDPDFRFIDLADYQTTNPYTVPGAPGLTDIYSLVTGVANGYGPRGSIAVDPNGRRYRHLKETSLNYKGDLEVPFLVGRLKQVIKTGFNYLRRDRSFGENVLPFPGTSLDGSTAVLYPIYGDLSQLVTYDKIGFSAPSLSDQPGQPRSTGFLYNIQKSPNNYTGFYEVRAVYGMADLKLRENLRLAGGVRFEFTSIQSVVDTANVYGANFLSGDNQHLVYNNPATGFRTNYEPYYSANLTYTLHKNMNFRLAYSTTLARPELRELTNIYEFDPFQFALVVGNRDLRNQRTQSFDFRWEWFTGSGEVFSASAFYKSIDNQLTKEFSLNSTGEQANAPEFPVVRFVNDQNRGKVYGIELEAVKNLGKLWKPLHNLFFGSNVLIAQSSIIKNPERLRASRIIDRGSSKYSPLFEQAPYSINAYIDYDNPVSGTTLTGTFNIVGERLIQVNLDGTPDLYTRPTPMLDFAFSQRISRHLLVKGFAKNLLNQDFREVYSDPANNGHFLGQTYTHRSFRRGSEVMIGLTYNLF